MVVPENHQDELMVLVPVKECIFCLCINDQLDEDILKAEGQMELQAGHYGNAVEKRNRSLFSLLKLLYFVLFVFAFALLLLDIFRDYK